ncbi:unnamed protein product [Discosporangium mesarthrocarpum]
MLTNGIHKWAPYLQKRQHSFAKPGSDKETVNGEVLAIVVGTLRPHCRSIRDNTQKATYNSYKRVHGLKFQGVVLPNRRFCDLHVSVVGSRHDAYMLGRSNLNPMAANVKELCGDTAYPNLSHVKQGSGVPPTFSQVRWLPLGPCQWPGSASSGALESLYSIAFLDYSKSQKLHLQAITELCIVAAL